MRSHKKLELSKETLRCLTDLSSEGLADVRGGVNQSVSTCLDCVTTDCPPSILECTHPIKLPPTFGCH